MDNKFSRSINNIDDSVFDKYYNYEEKLKLQKAIKIRKRNKFIAIAACLTFCVCASVALILPAMKSTEPTIEPDNILEVNTNNELSRPENSTEESDTIRESFLPEDNTGEADTIEEYITSIETEEECTHNWKCISPNNYEYKCSHCNEIHFCVNPEDWERAGNFNESTAIYKCKICGCEHLTTDPDSIKPDDKFNDDISFDLTLNLDIIDSKLKFQTVAITPCIVYSNFPISEMSNGKTYDNGHDIMIAIFNAMNGKTAILDTYECEFLHYIYLFDSDNDNDSWHYKFYICDCGAVTIIDNDGFLCSLKISDEELQMILDSLD